MILWYAFIGGLIGCIVLFYAFGLRHVLTYKLGTSDVEAYYFGFVRTLQVPYRDIKSARLVSFRESMSMNGRVNRAGNKLSGPVLVLERKDSLLTRVLLTPDDAPEFLHELQKRVESTKVER